MFIVFILFCEIFHANKAQNNKKGKSFHSFPKVINKEDTNTQPTLLNLPIFSRQYSETLSPFLPNP